MWYKQKFVQKKIKKWKNKIYKLCKIDHRIAILQLTRFRSKKQKKNENEIGVEKDGERN